MVLVVVVWRDYPWFNLFLKIIVCAYLICPGVVKVVVST